MLVSGSFLSHYRIKEQLGVGGMGEVYRAEDTRLKREVALKVLPSEVATDQERLGRFQREAQILATFDHPSIVTIFSVEECEGIHFLTMQLIHGKTLDQLIRAGGLPLEQFFDIATQLTEALVAAHDRGVIHRDLKPSNIMLTPQGRVKVLDFGLAKPAVSASQSREDRGSTEFLSNDGMVVGTIPYMSPEQIAAKSVDHRTDIFSLGVVLFEMLTARHPFSGDTPAARLIALVSEAPARVDEIRPDLSKEVADLIDRCLKKDISDRVQHVNEVATVLRNLSNDRLTSKPAVSQPTVSLNTSSKEESIGVLPFRSLSRDTDDEFFAEGISEEIINALSRLPDVKVAARTSAFSFKGKNEDLRVIGEKLGVRRILEGSVRRSGDRVRITVQLVDATTGYHLWSERYDRESGDVFDIQDEIARKIASHLTATISSTLDAAIVHHGTKDVDAFRIYAQGRGLLEHRTADEMWRAVSCFERAIERDPGYAHAWTGLADALVLLEDYRFAVFESLTSRAKEASVRALELDPELAEAHASRALLHGLRREGEAALEELEKAIFYKPNYADAHNWLGWLLVILGKASRGVKYSKRAVELNPLSPEALSNLSLAYLAIGDYQQALKEAQRSKEIQPYFETAMFFEGLSHFFLKDFDRAKSILQKISVPWAGQGPMGVVGLAHVASGEITTAKKLLSELKESDAACAALIHLAMGEHEAGLALFETVDRWDYWPTLSILTLFPDVFEALQDDPQYKNLKRKVLAFWGMKPDPSAE